MNRDEYYASLNSNRRLAHASAKGTQRENHNYYQRIKVGVKNGRDQFRYFYSAKEYQTYLNGAKRAANKVGEKVRTFTTAAGKTIKKAATDATRKTAKKVMDAASKKYNQNLSYINKNDTVKMMKEQQNLASSKYRKDISKNYKDSKAAYDKARKEYQNNSAKGTSYEKQARAAEQANLKKLEAEYRKNEKAYNSVESRIKDYETKANNAAPGGGVQTEHGIITNAKVSQSVKDASRQNSKLHGVMDMARKISLNPEKAGELLGAAAKDAASKTASKALKTAAKQAEKVMKKLQSQGAKGQKKLANIIKDSVQKMYDSTDINKDAEYLRALDSEKNSKEVLSNYQKSYNVKDDTSQVTNKKTGKKANDLETAMYDDAVVTNFRSKQTQANKKSRYNSKGNQTKRRILKTVKNVTDKW